MLWKRSQIENATQCKNHTKTAKRTIKRQNMIPSPSITKNYLKTGMKQANRIQEKGKIYAPFGSILQNFAKIYAIDSFTQKIQGRQGIRSPPVSPRAGSTCRREREEII